MYAGRLVLGHCAWVWVLPVPVALVGDGGKEKKAISGTIKKAEESVEAMNVARKSMLKYNSSFAEGLQT